MGATGSSTGVASSLAATGGVSAGGVSAGGVSTGAESAFGASAGGVTASEGACAAWASAGVAAGSLLAAAFSAVSVLSDSASGVSVGAASGVASATASATSFGSASFAAESFFVAASPLPDFFGCSAGGVCGSLIFEMWILACFASQRTAAEITRGSPVSRRAIDSSNPATAASASGIESMLSASAFKSLASPFCGSSTRTASTVAGSGDSPASCFTRRAKRSSTRCELDLRMACPIAGSCKGVACQSASNSSFNKRIESSARTAAANAHKLDSLRPESSSRRYRAKNGGEYPC